MLRGAIAWAYRHAGRWRRVEVVTFDDKQSFRRVEFLWRDEIHDGAWDRHLRWLVKENPGAHDSFAWTGMGPPRFNRPPLWRPFNAFLHCWRPRHDGEEMHDHPRWTVTVCLAGQLIEKTPWGERTLRPGSIVVRSRKAIHAFSVEPRFRGKTWTLFIVGRRNHRQNTYAIVAR